SARRVVDVTADGVVNVELDIAASVLPGNDVDENLLRGSLFFGSPGATELFPIRCDRPPSWNFRLERVPSGRNVVDLIDAVLICRDFVGIPFVGMPGAYNLNPTARNAFDS